MRLLKPGVKTTGMNIQHPTEQANRPATGVVTDKGVPQSDSFAKYAAFFNISFSISMRCSFFLSLRISICSGVIGEAFGVLP
ncbi:transposase [Escherichia coli]|nr:transposase [Escherichia coli]